MIRKYVEAALKKHTNSAVVCRGDGTGGAGVAIAPPIFLGIGKILAFSTPNISRSKDGAAMEKSLAPPIFYTFRRQFWPPCISTCKVVSSHRNLWKK